MDHGKVEVSWTTLIVSWDKLFRHSSAEKNDREILPTVNFIDNSFTSLSYVRQESGQTEEPDDFTFYENSTRPGNHEAKADGVYWKLFTILNYCDLTYSLYLGTVGMP